MKMDGRKFKDIGIRGIKGIEGRVTIWVEQLRAWAPEKPGQWRKGIVNTEGNGMTDVEDGGGPTGTGVTISILDSFKF